MQIAKFLLDIGAVKFNVTDRFTWASGLQSPIYCDNRIINSHVEVRDAVTNAFKDLILDKYIAGTDCIAGVATGAISFGVLVADRLKKPFIYVREERKKHGLKKIIEGECSSGSNIIVIEDLISTGGSSMKAVKGLKEEGLQVVCLLSIMTYRFQMAEDLFKNERVNQQSLCDLDTILPIALQQGVIDSGEVEAILNFRETAFAKSTGQL